MLLQSEIGCIKLLPALPDEWQEGKVKGLVAKGNVTADISWENSRVKKVYLSSPISQTITVLANGEAEEYELTAGKTLKIKF